MPRYALKIEYQGCQFSGWQRQVEKPTVQQSIEDALAKLEPRKHRIFAAGRTDAGVHARGQIAHCDMEKNWEAFRLCEALNFHLNPLPIAITSCVAVKEDWHARFSAIERRYLFRLLCRRVRTTHDHGLVWQVNHELALEPMQEAAKYLLGKHDFTTFRSSMCQASSPIKTLNGLQIELLKGWSGQEFRFYFRAPSFLHKQVRSFVGTLERVGAMAWRPEDVKTALIAKDRSACGPVCPPQGLYLDSVRYQYDPFVASLTKL